MTDNFASSGVFYAADLPLSWAPISRIDSAQCEQLQHDGAALLRAFAVFDTQLPEAEREISSPAGKAMERLEAKLDLALCLMAQIVRQQAEVPTTHPIELRAKSLAWKEETPPALQQLVLVSLHLSPKLSQALTLPATVTGLERKDNGLSRVQADFVCLSEDTEEWLERTLFRFHRRGIQQNISRRHNEN